MSRGLVLFVLQLALVLIVTAVGCVALVRPRLAQRFLNDNFHLLPAPSEDGRVTPAILILFGMFLIYYGIQLGLAVKQEIGYAVDAVMRLTG